jgi:hypothetical protein
LAKDLIIGGASNYTWDQLKYWINSIRQSGFNGDVAIVGTNMTKETIDKLSSEGIILSLYGTKQANGDITAPTNNAPHVERFFYLWNFLHTTETDYRYVITTDTRDVIFQRNPSDFLKENLGVYSLIASSEGMRYKNEPWGNQNLLETFGPYFHNIYKEKMIYNVGTIAGFSDSVKGLLSFIFHLSVNRPIPIVDQAVYNFIIHNEPFASETYFAANEDAWAIQLGTTIEAVAAGKGDLGAMFAQEPSKYKELYEDDQPEITDEGIVLNEFSQRFCIVHQYDRIPELKAIVEKKYES